MKSGAVRALHGVGKACMERKRLPRKSHTSARPCGRRIRAISVSPASRPPRSVPSTRTTRSLPGGRPQPNVRGLPVVEGGRLVGRVSLSDIAIARDPTSALIDISEAPPNT
jgi:hypothetical protein